MTLEEALKRHFSFDSFRSGQDEIIREIASGQDVMVIMPTGGGKSLCYQLPALMKDGVAVVISPLIALMKDQVDALAARGIPAAFLNSSLSPAAQRERLDGLARGAYKLIYIAPERFRHRRFMEELANAPISFFAIDEAHCVSQWGHDFRPDYLRIGQSLERLGSPPVCAFTATATPEVQADIVKHLNLREPRIYVTGFSRPNLEFRVAETDKKAEKLGRLASIIEAHRTGIVYCATRKRVEEGSEHLAEWDIAHIAYHGGMEDAERERLQESFIRREADVAVATNAFGMGIDRADIRFVVHFEIPGSVEAYYQEAGRAGRDGLPAICELFFNFADRRTQDFFIDGSNPGKACIADVYRFLVEMADENGEVRMSLNELSDRLGSRNGMMVSTSVNLLTRLGVLERFDIPGERIRGTRLLKPDITPEELPLDAAALAEKERRDRAKLQSVIDYGYARACRQQWIRGYFGEADPDPCGVCDFCRANHPDNLREPREEEWVILQKALSGVARMSHRGGGDAWRPRFGKGRIILMLSGSRSEGMRQFGLDRLSTYGVLKRESSRYLHALFDELLRAGLLRSTGGDRPLVTLTALGEAVMKRDASVQLLWPERESAGAAPTTGAPDGAPLRLGAEPDGDLLEHLKRKRAQLAAAQGKVPHYRIFSNAVLESLAAQQPQSEEEALRIPGIGPSKARTVLPAFLKIIRDRASP